MNSFYTHEELKNIGFREIGINVFISKKASFYGVDKINIGNNVRIDDFCILSGKIQIGNYIHIAAYTSIYGGDSGVYINDFANISSKNSIYSISDDYSGETMTSPMVPEKYKSVLSAPVHIMKHVIIGSGCVILPNVTINEGAAIGSMSLVNKSTEAWKIYAGIPAKAIKDRKKDLLNLEKDFLRG